MQLYKQGLIINTITLIDADRVQFDHQVSDDLVGEYTCNVSGRYMEQDFDYGEAFYITGIIS